MNCLFDKKAEKIIFHFNKKHNEDQTIPPWIIKFKGSTYYINHLDIEPGIGFSTKESPDNEHTKASLAIKGRLELYTKESKQYARIY